MARDTTGSYKAADGKGGMLCYSSLMAEGVAVKLALLACFEHGWAEVIIESD